MEIWKEVKDYEDYMISSQGRVKSLKFGKEKFLKLAITCHGYFTVRLSKNGKIIVLKIHRLIYQAFIGELIDELVIDHIDGNKLNNSLNNLQQITIRENTTKGERTKNKTSIYVGVSWYTIRNKWRCDIKTNGIRKYLGCFDNEEEAAQAYQDALEALKQI